MDEKPKAYPNNVREMSLETDLGRVCEIWLKEVKRAHLLICNKFWDSRLSAMTEETQQANEKYVYEEDGIIRGFITARQDGYIFDLYVESQFQNQGIGKKLLKELREKHPELTLSLSVYKQNSKAFEWYKKRRFKVSRVRYCPDTEFLKFDMIWKPDRKESSTSS